MKRITIIMMLLTVATYVFSSVGSTPPPEGSTDERIILTPPPPHEPRVNCAKVFGLRPGSECQFLVATSGDRPMTFSAKGLPKGLYIDKETGLVSGRTSRRGEYAVVMTATNALGSDQRTVRFKVGDEIALTPPMGWNSWNCWGKTVSQERVMASARAMRDKGLINYGWTYINIDDGWQGIRGGRHNAIQPNKKFPDIKGLADSIHDMGLKMGIYSTAWVITFAGHIGSTCPNADGTYPWITKGDHNDIYKLVTDDDPTGDRASWRHHYYGDYSFTDNDARQWAEWGVDYLKYDWYPNDYDHVEEMNVSLRKQKRDIVYSLSGICLYSLAPAWARLTNCFRTTGDITDSWTSLLSIGFHGQQHWTGFNGPGHWADPDMLIVGMVGWGDKLHPTRLTPDEQYTHISLWALLAAPMLIGCDIAQMDDFTLSLLCNREVNDIDQDPLGVQAYPVKVDGDRQTWVKQLEDGSLAVGLFNLGEDSTTVGFAPKDFGILGEVTVRDVWRQQDVAAIKHTERFECRLPKHGCRLLLLRPKDCKSYINYPGQKGWPNHKG